jgi:hypothetical protein
MSDSTTPAHRYDAHTRGTVMHKARLPLTGRWLGWFTGHGWSLVRHRWHSSSRAYAAYHDLAERLLRL